MPPSPTPTEPSPDDQRSARPSATRWARAIGRLPRHLPRAVPFLALTPLLPAVWFVNRFNPTDGIPDPTGPCLYHELTGLNGPTCGGTRMFYFLIHGDLAEATRHHLPALLAVPVLGYLWLRWALSRFGVDIPRLRLPVPLLIAYGAFFVVFSMVLRNIGWGPFDWFNIAYLDASRSR